MLKRLQSMNPRRYDLPTENQIQKFISKLTSDENKTRKEAEEVRMQRGNEPTRLCGMKRNGSTDKESIDGSGNGDGDASPSRVKGERTGRAALSTKNEPAAQNSNVDDGDETGAVIQLSGAEGIAGGEVVGVPAEENCTSMNKPAEPKKYSIPNAYGSVLNDIIRCDPTIKPAKVRPIMMERFG